MNLNHNYFVSVCIYLYFISFREGKRTVWVMVFEMSCLKCPLPSAVLVRSVSAARVASSATTKTRQTQIPPFHWKSRCEWCVVPPERTTMTRFPCIQWLFRYHTRWIHSEKRRPNQSKVNFVFVYHFRDLNNYEQFVILLFVNENYKFLHKKKIVIAIATGYYFHFFS